MTFYQINTNKKNFVGLKIVTFFQGQISTSRNQIIFPKHWLLFI